MRVEKVTVIAQQLRSLLHTRIARLTLSYLLVIMVMSLSFSIVYYHVSTHELNRQVPPPEFRDPAMAPFLQGQRTQQFFAQRAEESRGQLLTQTIVDNVIVLLGGSVISYYLARRTLQPIERAIEAQSRFASDASHELRTPLAVIQTENEVALRKKDLSVAQAKEVLASNVEEVIKLRSLSESLLRLAREEPHELKLVAVSAQDITTDAINHVIKIAQTKRISITDKMPKFDVMSDEASLRQAVIVLLDNAIKYSPAGSTVHIEGYKRSNYGYLKIRDEGPGIKAEDLPHIFDRFYRADQSRSKTNVEGHGLGLSLAQKIIHGQHGELMVQSKTNKGTTFIIKLPLA